MFLPHHATPQFYCLWIIGEFAPIESIQQLQLLIRFGLILWLPPKNLNPSQTVAKCFVNVWLLLHHPTMFDYRMHRNYFLRGIFENLIFAYIMLDNLLLVCGNKLVVKHYSNIWLCHYFTRLKSTVSFLQSLVCTYL